MKNLNVNKFQLNFNFVTTKECFNENDLLKVTLTPTEFFHNENIQNDNMIIIGKLIFKYRDNQMTLNYFRYQIGGDIRYDIYKYLKYSYFAFDDKDIQNRNFFLELIETIKPQYTQFK